MHLSVIKHPKCIIITYSIFDVRQLIAFKDHPPLLPQGKLIRKGHLQRIHTSKPWPRVRTPPPKPQGKPESVTPLCFLKPFPELPPGSPPCSPSKVSLCEKWTFSHPLAACVASSVLIMRTKMLPAISVNKGCCSHQAIILQPPESEP